MAFDISGKGQCESILRFRYSRTPDVSCPADSLAAAETAAAHRKAVIPLTDRQSYILQHIPDQRAHIHLILNVI